MRTPHKHAELIKAWADGAEIQVKSVNAEWHDMSHTPTWDDSKEYRIKPAAPPKVYPETKMTRQQINEAILPSGDHRISFAATEAGYRVANAALRHAIDAEQVVPMAEVLTLARDLNKRQRAARDTLAAIIAKVQP